MVRYCDNVFEVLSEKWHKGYPDKGGQKSIGFVSPKLRFGLKNALFLEDSYLPPKNAFLELSLRVSGRKPSLQRLHCYIKFEWDIRAQFEVSYFKNSTFIIKFTTVPDYLCAADCT